MISTPFVSFRASIRHGSLFLLLLSFCFIGKVYAASSAPIDASSWLNDSDVEGVSLRGPLVQGGLLIGEVSQGTTVFGNGSEIYVDAAGRFAIGLDRDAAEVFELTLAEGKAQQTLMLPVQQRNYEIQRIEGVEKKYVEPDPEQVKRSRRDVQRVIQARKYSSGDDRFMSGFSWPAIGPISGVFGSQRVYNGEPRRPHYGVDIAREKGAPVVAPAAGVVTLAEDLFFSGMTIIIDHGHYVSSSFLHLDKIHVEVGDKVEKGQRIGDIGDTGRVTGPHLDWRMNWTGGEANVRIDPQLLVPAMPSEDGLLEEE